MTEDKPICEFFGLICELHQARGLENMKVLGVWEFDVLSEAGCSWHVAMNGHGEDRTIEPDGMMPVDVPPYHAAIWWNGWLAGIVHPYGGTIAAHPEGANEDRLLDDLKRLITKEGVTT